MVLAAGPSRDVASVEKAGLTLETVHEISVGRWDPLSLAIRAQLQAGA